MKQSRRLIVFAKAPDAGTVKTRLIPLLGAEGAARLHRQLVEYALGVAVEAACAPVELCCAPDAQHPFFTTCRDRFGVTLTEQASGDLGARMYRAFDRALASAESVVLIGTDCVDLTATDLGETFQALEDGNDAVLGPAEDGGYVLIGLRRCARTVFDGIGWSAATVLAETRERFARLQWRWHELPVRSDIDRPEDYQRLVREGVVPASEMLGTLRPTARQKIIPSPGQRKG